MSWQSICSACGFFIQGHTTSRVCTPRPVIEFHLSMVQHQARHQDFIPNISTCSKCGSQTYSWWFRNPANSPVELASLSTHYLQGFYTSQVIVSGFLNHQQYQWINPNFTSSLGEIHQNCSLPNISQKMCYTTFTFAHCSGGSSFDLWRKIIKCC